VYICRSTDSAQNGTFTVISATATTFTYSSPGTGTGATVNFGKNSNSQNLAALVNRGASVSLNA
jgi:hypothetical protein